MSSLTSPLGSLSLLSFPPALFALSSLFSFFFSRARLSSLCSLSSHADLLSHLARHHQRIARPQVPSRHCTSTPLVYINRDTGRCLLFRAALTPPRLELLAAGRCCRGRRLRNNQSALRPQLLRSDGAPPGALSRRSQVHAVRPAPPPPPPRHLELIHGRDPLLLLCRRHVRAAATRVPPASPATPTLRTHNHEPQLPSYTTRSTVIQQQSRVITLSNGGRSGGVLVWTSRLTHSASAPAPS